ncbi:MULTISPECIES: hypothetical protein [Clavibacter]|uniref:hypothetical protein n=1 Tax=Clavibacter TaxID=1573 RepID=UPI001BE0BCC8|nr:hypothetical protein [Clavibacter michiganensis]MBT1636154.1 hypothetical protein [Clavibacter michiganensis]
MQKTLTSSRAMSRLTRRRPQHSFLILALTVAVLSVAGVAPAHAAERPVEAGLLMDGHPSASPGAAIAPDKVAQLHRELRSSAITPKIRDDHGRPTEMYELPNGIVFNFPVEAHQEDGVGASLIGAGIDDSQGPYISFNKLDQQAISAGGGAALEGTICVLGGAAACVVAGTVIAVVEIYLQNNGICGGDGELRLYLAHFEPQCA